jgi:phospholipid/cholesterol/gamma-HCH transport system substrate-binding protein
MARQIINNLKLGVFVITGMVLLVIALYMIGKDQSLFTSSFRVKARFRNIAGLMAGNNVRYAGIPSGTVKGIRILNDTTIEITMLLNEEVRAFVRKNAIAAIGTEGLMGNKVVNIIPNAMPGDPVENDALLQTAPQADLGAAMETLYSTNDNASIIATELVETVRRINGSPVLWKILSDTNLSANLQASLVQVRMAASRLNNTTRILGQTVADMRSGKGTIGLLLTDDSMRAATENALMNIRSASQKADQFMARLDSIGGQLQYGMNNKNGLVNKLLLDTTIAGQLSRSIESVEEGTAAFNEDMEALKHNMLTRGYFRKKAKKKR